MKAQRIMLALSVALLGIACKDSSGPDGQPGTLRVVLTTPNSGADGAAVVILSAPAVPRSVSPGAGLELWGTVATAVDTIALTGVLNTGTILALQVGDVRRVSEYSASLREVANGDASVALRDLTGYALTVVP